VSLSLVDVDGLHGGQSRLAGGLSKARDGGTAPRPLLAVAACAEDLALVPDLLALAREHVADRDDLSAEGEALLAVLAEHLGRAPAVMVRPGALATVTPSPSPSNPLILEAR